MLRMVAPAGVAVPMREMIRAALQTATPERASDLTQRLEIALGAKRVWWTCSGRAALLLAFQALHVLRPERDIVAIPGYTCYSVAAAAIRAGLKLKLIEVSPCLQPRYESLESAGGERVLCVVTAGLFGVPDDSTKVAQVAGRIGAFVVEDCAQCLGATRQGQLAGSNGHIAICSFGRGKPLPLGQGGAIVAHTEDVIESIDSCFDKMGAQKSNIRMFLEVLLTSVFLRSWLYWIPDAMPFLKLGLTEFNPNFAVCRGTEFSNALGGHLFTRLDELREARHRRARRLIEVLAGAARFTVPSIPEECVPNLLRLPVLASDYENKVNAVAALRARGVAAAVLYPTAICDIPGIATHMAEERFHQPCAEGVAARLFSLPTHPLVSEGDIITIGETLQELRT